MYGIYIFTLYFPIESMYGVFTFMSGQCFMVIVCTVNIQVPLDPSDFEANDTQQYSS